MFKYINYRILLLLLFVFTVLLLEQKHSIQTHFMYKYYNKYHDTETLYKIQSNTMQYIDFSF